MHTKHFVVSAFFAIASFTGITTALPQAASAGVFLSVTIAPPALPVYVQPPCPGDGFIWTPGYWAYGDAGYYWVPGTWVQAPQVGFLWTPGYWGWGGSAYIFHAGYWGPHIGFYGGINYGFGYTGVGYEGGFWRGGIFSYNRSVNNINVTVVHNVYNKTVINNTVNRTSFNGGRGGIAARPSRDEEMAQRDRHVAATGTQMQHEQAAGRDRGQLASVNHGTPGVTASPRPGQFAGQGVVRGQQFGGNSRPGQQFGTNRSAPASQPEPGRPGGYNASRGAPQAAPHQMSSAPRSQPPTARSAPRDMGHEAPRAAPQRSAPSRPAPHASGHEEHGHR